MEPTQCIKIGGNVSRYGAESRVNVLRYVMQALGYGAESRVNVLRQLMHVLR